MAVGLAMAEPHFSPPADAYDFPAGSPYRLGMDMVAPYGVYLEGCCIAVYDDEESATQHFNRLRNPKASPGAREQQL